MKKKEKNGVVINTNLLVSIILLLLTSYSTYVVSDLKSEMQKQYQTICQLADKIQTTSEKLFAHLGWHDGHKKF